MDHLPKTSRKVDSHGNHFLDQGPAFKEGFASEPFENVNVYSLMCHLLGIKPEPNNGSTSSAASAKLRNTNTITQC